jgi:ribose transport system substrate-binding protein
MIKRFVSIFLLPALMLVLCAGWAQAQASKSAQAAKAKAAEAAKSAKPAEATLPRPHKPAKSYTIGVLIPQLSNPHFIGQAFGYTDEAEKLGARIILHDAGGYQYIEKQVAQMEDLIASKVDAIDLVAINGSATVPMVDAAVAAGIPVINCNVMTENPKVVTRIRSDDTEIGEKQADFMAKALNYKGNVVMLRGPAGTSWAQIRGDSFKKRMAAIAPNIKILGEQFSQSTPQDGMRLMEDFLQTFPQIDGVYNGADMTGVGAANALQAAGKAGKVIITATDLQPDNEKFLRTGAMTATVLQQTVTIGRWCIRATIDYLEHRPLQKEYFTPLSLATKDTIDKVDMTTVRAPVGWKPPVR